jgi:hypothetical protein
MPQCSDQDEVIHQKMDIMSEKSSMCAKRQSNFPKLRCSFSSFHSLSLLAVAWVDYSRWASPTAFFMQFIISNLSIRARTYALRSAIFIRRIKSADHGQSVPCWRLPVRRHAINPYHFGNWDQMTSGNISIRGSPSPDPFGPVSSANFSSRAVSHCNSANSIGHTLEPSLTRIRDIQHGKSVSIVIQRANLMIQNRFVLWCSQNANYVSRDAVYRTSLRTGHPLRLDICGRVSLSRDEKICSFAVPIPKCP